MAKRKVYVVLNGKAGRRGLEFSKQEIEKGFKECDPEVDVEFGVTERRMHAAELANEAAKRGGYYAIVAAGGDGTVNEVSNGLANTGATMGIIPNGSTNVFCSMEMKISSKIEEATRNVLEGIPVKVDLGKVNGRYFIWMLGVGIEAKIANEVNPKIKKYFGVLAYVISALKQLTSIGYEHRYGRDKTVHIFHVQHGGWERNQFRGILRSQVQVRDKGWIPGRMHIPEVDDNGNNKAVEEFREGAEGLLQIH